MKLVENVRLITKYIFRLAVVGYRKPWNSIDSCQDGWRRFGQLIFRVSFNLFNLSLLITIMYCIYRILKNHGTRTQ